MHVWPDEALTLGVIGRSIVAVVVECLVTPARLPIVHVGSGSRNHPPSVGGVLRRGGVDVFSRWVSQGAAGTTATMLPSLGGEDQVALAFRVRGQHDFPWVLYPDHPSSPSASVQELGAQVDDGVVGAGCPHGGEEGLALVPVGVWETHGPFLLQRGLLRGGQQTRVHLSFRPAVGCDKRVVRLWTTPLAAAGSRYTHYWPAAALPQHALLFVILAAGTVASWASRVAVAMTHDPADSEAREDSSGCEGRDSRHHQQVYRHQSIGLLDETLLEQQPYENRETLSVNWWDHVNSISVSCIKHVGVHKQRDKTAYFLSSLCGWERSYAFQPR